MALIVPIGRINRRRNAGEKGGSYLKLIGFPYFFFLVLVVCVHVLSLLGTTIFIRYQSNFSCSLVEKMLVVVEKELDNGKAGCGGGDELM